MAERFLQREGIVPGGARVDDEAPSPSLA